MYVFIVPRFVQVALLFAQYLRLCRTIVGPPSIKKMLWFYFDIIISIWVINNNTNHNTNNVQLITEYIVIGKNKIINNISKRQVFERAILIDY